MSGGAPSNTTSQTTTELPAWAQPYAQTLLDRGSALSDQPMPVYEGQRSAAMNGNQIAGMNMAADRATSGSADVNKGSQALQDTLGGTYLNRSTGTNSYMGSQPGSINPYLGKQPTDVNGMIGKQTDGANQYMGQQPTDTNAYMGENPYLQSTIDKAAQDITRNYQGAVNSNDATMARSGAFGGSAWQQAQEGAQRQLATGLGDSANTLRFQNYAKSADLAESALARQQDAFKTNAAMADSGLGRTQNYFTTNAGLVENGLNRGVDAFKTNATMADSGLARDQGYFNTNANLAENGLNRNQAAFTSERANQMAGLPLALQYGQQPYLDAAQLQAAGGQQYGYDQQILADQQALFNERANAPYRSLDVLGNTIRGAVGGGSTVSQSAPGANPYAQAAGGAAALYGLMGK